MTDIYDHCLNLGEWNSKKAALIFNGKDPRLYEKKIVFPLQDNDYSRVKPNTWQWKALDYYYIFETAGRPDWERCGADVSNPNFWFRTFKTASPSVFINLAKDKQLDLPVELLEKSEKLLASSHESQTDEYIPIGEKRLRVLKTWLTTNNCSATTPLEMTRRELWNLLSNIDGVAFAPRSDETINSFFKSQNNCTFKPGRKKG